MRFIFLFIFVFSTVQPLQASLCDMHNAQGTSHGQHSDTDGQSKDCCDNDQPQLQVNCDPVSQCDAGAATAVVVEDAPAYIVFSTAPRQFLMPSGNLLFRFHTPPFRPPIG